MVNGQALRSPWIVNYAASLLQFDPQRSTESTKEAGPAAWTDWFFGPALATSIDTWSVSATEGATALAGSSANIDTWSASWTDSSSVNVSQPSTAVAGDGMAGWPQQPRRAKPQKPPVEEPKPKPQIQQTDR